MPAAASWGTQDRDNLVALTRYALSLGFVDFLLEFIPEWDCSYANWLNVTVMGEGQTRPFQPLAFDELESFTFDVCRVMRTVTANFWVDPLGEGTDEKVCSRLWSDWCDQNGGVANCLGFSIVPTQANIDRIPRLYTNGLLPNVFNVHPYFGNGGELSWSQFKLAMRARGYAQGFLIGETDANSPEQAAALAADKADLFWLYQWPVGTDTPPNITQDRLTLAYGAYQQAGL